jgi:hypothetical protein
MTLRAERARLELAGLVEPNGKFGRIVESGRLASPGWMHIERGNIHWKGFNLLATIEPPPDLLDRFAKLWNANDAAILEFAQKYGTLRRPLSLFRTTRKSDCEGREPLVRWRELSGHASRLLEIAAALRAREKLGFEQWSEVLFGERESALLLRKAYSGVTAHLRKVLHKSPTAPGLNVKAFVPTEQAWLVEVAKGYLEDRITAWNQKLGPVTFGIERDDHGDGWKTVFDFGGSLPCYIGFQLMLVVAGGDIFMCSACRKPYIRPRGRQAPRGLRKVPAAGRRNYCQSKECIRERNRLAKAQSRERLAQEHSKEK